MIGWTFRDGLWRNDGVARDPHAIERGGSIAFDPATLGSVILPWSDGTGALLRHTPILPDGLIVGTPEELAHGWRYPCAGALTAIEVVDLQLTSQLSYLREFGAEGLKTIWWMITARVQDDGGGWWRPKRSAITGTGTFNAYEQSEGEGEDRPHFAKGSIAYYGAEDQQGVVLRPDGSILRAFHTGKIWHSPRPTALFWSDDGRLLGIVYGRLEWDALNSHEVKAYPLDSCMALVAAGAVQVSIDATLGYTSVGSSWSLGPPPQLLLQLGITNGDGEISSVSFYPQATRTTIRHAVFDESPSGYLRYRGNSDVSGDVTGGVWNTFSYGGSKPTIEVGQKYFYTYGGGNTQNYKYDTVSGYNNRKNTAAHDGASWATKDGTLITSTFPTAFTTNQRASAYITYTQTGFYLTVSDTGAGSDALGSLSATATVTDTANATDLVTLDASLALDDTGLLTDALGIGATLTVPDNGVVLDAVEPATVDLTVSDEGVALDIVEPAVVDLITVSDEGEGVDAPVIAAALTLEDSGELSDNLEAVAVAFVLADAGECLEALQIANDLAVHDDVTGLDAIIIRVHFGLSDDGAGVDDTAEPERVHTITDAASAVDGVAAVATLTVADTGIGTDAVIIAVALALTDSGEGADALAVRVALAIEDAGAGSDALGPITVSATVADEATIAEAIGIVARLGLVDHGAGIDYLFRHLRIPTNTIEVIAEGTAATIKLKGTAAEIGVNAGAASIKCDNTNNTNTK